jgi:chitin disaccharide deacetylase
MPENAGSATRVFLCADDFAMTNGVSRAIVELVEAGRLSGTSAMTSSTHWPAHATWLARLRGRISTGLHLNLTLGAPLGQMAQLAPAGRFPTVGRVTSLALRHALPRVEIEAEIARQLAAFEREVGFPPDHIDGHQHVHALPVIRDALLAVLTRRFPAAHARPLLRVPGDTIGRTIMRGRSVGKSLTLGGLTAGFSGKAHSNGFPTNTGFAGVTGFAPGAVRADFRAACRAPGPRHMVMCHPGFVDDELVRLDPVRDRRQKEFDMLMAGEFPMPVWRPQRSDTGEPIDWSAGWAGSP